MAQQSIVLARTIHSLGWRRVALVLGTAALSVSAAAAFRDEARLLVRSSENDWHLRIKSFIFSFWFFVFRVILQ